MTISPSSVHHDGSARYVSNLYPALGETIQIRLRTAPGAPIQRVLIRTTPDGEQHFADLAPQPPTRVCQWWSMMLPATMPIVNYRFVLLTTDGLLHFNGTGLHHYAPTDHHDFRIVANYHAPQWVTRSVFYQIFPDRFADGDATNNVGNHEWQYFGQPTTARQWDEPPSHTNASGEFYGGDLQGIRERLPYLAQLGVNALYLNPIFTAPSVHRYDVASYDQVDPHLGGNEALAELRHALDAHNMRLMLDIVPNHCGVQHPWFRAAQADPHSNDFFIWEHHPDRYVSWLGVRSLPKLNYESHTLRRLMYAAPNSVMRRWLQPPYRIDGWRVDVANMLGQHGATQLNSEVARGIRAAVKEEQPDGYLLSEHFFDATALLQGDQYDGNMNYRGFTVPLWDWLAGQRLRHGGFGEEIAPSMPLPTDAIVAAWNDFRAAIPWVIAQQQFNLVDSHDTARIGSLVGGNERLQRLAVVLQLTYPGVPCVLYGDEIGLLGDASLSTRRTMPWNEDQWNHGLLAFYRQLIALRRESEALAVSGFQILHADDDTVAYLRDTEHEQIIMVGYRGAAERPAQQLPIAHGAIGDGTRFVDVLSGMEVITAGGCLPLPAMEQGGVIWRSVPYEDRERDDDCVCNCTQGA